MRKLFTLAILAAIAGIALGSGPTDIRDIEDRAASGEPAAIRALRDSAEAGNLRAMNFLGFLYWQGQGTTLHRDSALYFLERASCAGDLKASANLGHLLLVGSEELPSDTARAIRLLEKGARRGLPSALRELADYFESHPGDSLSAGAIKTVADAYAHGHVLPYDYHRSIELYNRAALLGDTVAGRIIKEVLEIFPDIISGGKGN